MNLRTGHDFFGKCTSEVQLKYTQSILILKKYTSGKYTWSILKVYLKHTSSLAIYKTRNTGTWNRMRGMQGMQGMFTMILGNLLKDSAECSHFSILGNPWEESGECYQRFWGMFTKSLENVQENCGECFLF